MVLAGRDDSPEDTIVFEKGDVRESTVTAGVERPDDSPKQLSTTIHSHNVPPKDNGLPGVWKRWPLG